MNQINLLIIEDETAQIQTYEDNIYQHNKKSEYKFTYTICKSFDEGKKALETPYYDAAIIDLKLSGSDELEGKKLVEDVYQKLRIPIIIYSGSIDQIDTFPENILLKKRLRTEKLTSILEEIILIYNTGITSLLKPAGKIDTKLTQIFWNHLSNDLELWTKDNNPDTLLRYILSHFQEYLEIDPVGDFQQYHPSEVYIRPAIKSNFHTGDLIRYNKAMFIILTPACDIVINYKPGQGAELGKKIAFRKSDTMLLASVLEFDIKTMCLNKNGEIDKGKIGEFVRNGSYRYHYLPPYLNPSGYVIDFQSLQSVKYDEQITKIASISSPFIKDIISRFSSYYSRQGQPTFNQEKIIDNLYASR
ncbi:MAG: hypothetical protein DI535_14180 [Citrobacter freundii]|nr:MAG: hypothetical protein DI535_14180 [Citrobacter freundii]